MPLVALAGGGIALLFTFGLKGFYRPTVTDEFKDLASSSGRALGALYALILALAFNTVMSEHSELEEAIDEEAILVAQILEDSLEEMDEATGREAVDDLVVYVDAVVNEEWKAQSAATVSRTADAALERLRTRLQTLEAENPSMAAELDQLLDEVERRRLQRLLDLEQSVPPVFWILSILLFFSTLIPFTRYSPTRANGVLIGTYGAAVGIVLYSILMLSEPFQSSMPVSDKPFRLVQGYLEQAISRFDRR
jgi:prefoldin subunit 5